MLHAHCLSLLTHAAATTCGLSHGLPAFFSLGLQLLHALLACCCLRAVCGQISAVSSHLLL